MIEFLSKLENRSITVARVNSILSPNLSIYSYLLLFCMALGSVVILSDIQCSVHL